MVVDLGSDPRQFIKDTSMVIAKFDPTIKLLRTCSYHNKLIHS
jgi:hypothetical protein